MPICQNEKCKSAFPSWIKIDGISKNLQNRKYCLECSPWGKHNTRPIRENPTSRPCPRCKNVLPLNEFYTRRKTNASSYCKKCTIQVQMQTEQQLQEDILNYAGNKCVLCGYNRCSAALEFHHVDASTKDIGISALIRRHPTLGDLIEEVNKCVLLCVNCHREAHAKMYGVVSKQALSHRKLKQQCVDYKGGGCLLCGYNKILGALECHHLDSSKKEVGIGKTYGKFETLIEELDKCVLLCANHHREVHNMLSVAVELDTILAASDANNTPTERYPKQGLNL